MSLTHGGIELCVLVSEETIQCLVEFKFLEESFTGKTCMICKLWICQRFVRKKKDVFITLLSVQWWQLLCLCWSTASELLLSGKQMQIAVLVYPFFPNFYSLVTFMDTIFKTHYKDLGTNTSSQTKFFMKKSLNSLWKYCVSV